MKRSFVYLILGITAAVCLRENNQNILFPVALSLLAIIDWRIFRLFLRWKLWFFFALLIAIPILLVGSKDAVWLGVPYNAAMLKLNILMVERSIVIMLTVKMFTNRLSFEAISRGLIRMKLVQFEQVFRLALAMLPEVRSIMMTLLQNLSWRQLRTSRAELFPLLSRIIAKMILHANSRTVREKG